METLDPRHCHILLKGKISLTPMESIFIIFKELEYFEGLMKLTKKKQDIEATWTQVTIVMDTLIIKQVCINKTHCNKSFHLVVKIN